MSRTRLALFCIALMHVGCGDSKPEPGVDPQAPQAPNDYTRGQAGATSTPVFPDSIAPADFPTLPTDTRAPIIAATPPPAISGGTMLVAADGVTVIAADSDRDRISIVDLAQRTLVAQIALHAGDEPGRLVQDARGLVHIVLRGTGEVATLDLGKQAITDRRQVCGAPRGIAYDANADALQIACVSGDLVTLPAAGGQVTRSMRVAEDLRDVVIANDGTLRISQFKSAGLLDVDAAGAVMHRSVPYAVHQRDLFAESLGMAASPRTFTAALARRAIPLNNGRTLVLHQREMTDTIQVQDPHGAAGTASSSTEPSSTEPPSAEPPSDEQVAGAMKPASAPMPSAGFVPGSEGGGSAYGGGDGCTSIVQTAISIVDEDGGIVQTGSLPGTVLAVDIAVSPDGSSIAVASAGARDPNAAVGGFGFAAMGFSGSGPGPVPVSPSINGLPVESSAGAGSVTLVSMSAPTFNNQVDLAEPCAPASVVGVGGQPVAVAYTQDGSLVVQSREPAALYIVGQTGTLTIALGGDSRVDTGHDLFHRDAGAGIACASCHGEGGDDGHVWNFSDNGARRTQSVNIGLEGTAPFHWAGDLKDLATLMDTVFVGRMGGAPQAPERVAALSGWLFAQQPPARMRAADDEAALRGKQLFDSKDVDCTSCHSGSKFTNNKSVDVGTGAVLQVPSLIGVAYRAPFIHDGCAATLRDRFNPECGGGEKHGHTAALNEAQIGDLVAYLETL